MSRRRRLALGLLILVLALAALIDPALLSRHLAPGPGPNPFM